MVRDLSPQEHGALLDVARVLQDTLGRVSTSGVLIRQSDTGMRNQITYTSADGRPIRTMSTEAYAAEFFKACGGDLQAADYDTVTSQCEFIGNVLASRAIVEIDIADLTMPGQE